MSEIEYPIEFSFDWNEDHSKWRLEEIIPQIERANKILLDKNLITQAINISYLGQLEELAKPLSRLYRDEEVDDKLAREAMLLADEFFVTINSSDYDARENYECLIENLKDELDKWSSKFTWFYIKDLDAEWEVSPISMLENLENSRYGLGERWSMKIEKDCVELPDGTVIYSFAPDKVQAELVEYFYYSYMNETEMVKIAEQIKSAPDEDYLTILNLTEIIADNHLLDNGGLSLFNTILDLSKKELTPLYFESLNVLAKEWNDDTASLLKACDHLVL